MTKMEQLKNGEIEFTEENLRAALDEDSRAMFKRVLERTLLLLPDHQKDEVRTKYEAIMEQVHNEVNADFSLNPIAQCENLMRRLKVSK